MKTKMTPRHSELLKIDDHLLSDELFDELQILQNDYNKKLNLECEEAVKTGELIDFYKINDSFLSLYKRDNDFIIELKDIIGSEELIDYVLPVYGSSKTLFNHLKLKMQTLSKSSVKLSEQPK